MRTLLILLLTITGWDPLSAADIDFNRQIRPLLSDNCIFCHGPDQTERKADLRLDTEAGAHRVIDSDHPLQSDLLKRIFMKDPNEVMPPPESGKSLTEEERQLIHDWVVAGAVWEEHWAYQSPKTSLRKGAWIDRHIDARLGDAGLSSTSKADKSTLLRRVTFDLTGLPPTPRETEAFLLDQSSDAFENVVDRLLDSPHYGERMAVYWLDLVRYADTVGYHGDQDHNISPYRDYVIAAFNDNLSFDQFTREQLAGDLLPDSTIDQKVATGYNRLLQTSHEGGVQAKEYLAIYAADRVRNVSNVWMAATLGCAQCHDHKYDPFTARDFYTMSAFFADIDEAQHFKVGTNALPTKRPPEMAVLSKADREKLAQIDRDLVACDRELASCLPASKDKRQALIAKRKTLLKTRTTLEKNTRVTMVTAAIEPRVTRVLPRGNWLDDSGEIVEPAVPKFLGSLTVQNRRPTRLDLANWFTDVENGSGKLTARVFANRFWYLLFGKGLSERLDDFGGQGVAPTHPELLDQLALAFIDSGWDIKAMMKLLVMTDAYQRSSISSDELKQSDPMNRLLGRQARYRMPAEMIRDSALAMSGLLVADIGGGSVKPYQPEGYFRHLNFPVRQYKSHQDKRQWRRGVYVHWQRQFLHPMMKAFDAPSREECTAERSRSNTPTAALTLLNDPTFVEAARVFAERLLREVPEGDHARIQRGFLIALSRAPDEAELTLLKTLLEEERSFYQEHGAAKQLLSQIGLAKPQEDLERTEIAAWTAVSRALLNLNETITRN